MCLLATLAIAGALACPLPCVAQEIAIPPNATPDQIRQIQEMSRSRAAARQAPASAASSDSSNPAEPPKEEAPKAGEAKSEDAKETKPESVTRSNTPAKEPDPEELKVVLDKDGLVPKFSFYGHPWSHVMQWFANLADESLDWHELPADYVNLFTDERLTIDEVRDLLNSLLQSRGYTMLRKERVLSVRKFESVTPAMIPSIDEQELFDRRPTEFVKVTFQLPDEMPVKEAAEDAKQVLGPHAKVMPMVATKRLLVMDVASNLQLLSNVINSEWAELEGYQNPREFHLRFARAQDVIDTVYLMVGLDPKSRPSQMDLQVQRQRLELLQQMQQRGTDVSKLISADGPPVYLAYNRQQNSILANAPPKEMKIIERTIKSLDTPPLGSGYQSAGGNMIAGRRMHSYELKTLSPGTLMMTLEEIGELDPRTELRVDDQAKSLIAMATDADHARISELIREMDGASREFYVIPLRNRRAEQVAPTVEQMMGGKKQDDANSLNRRYTYIYNYGTMSANENRIEFSVKPDIERNQLMMWATDEEYEQVREFLVKLGERFDDSNRRNVRVLPPRSPEDTALLLEELRRSMAITGDDQLQIDLPPGYLPQEAPSQEATVNQPSDTTEPEDAKEGKNAKVPSDSRVHHSHRSISLVAERTVHSDSEENPGVQSEAERGDGRLLAQAADSPLPDVAENESTANRPMPVGPASSKPTIKISLGPDGELLLSGDDPAAIDRLENMIRKIPPRDYKIYRLRYADALTVTWNLEDYFADATESDSGNDAYMMYYYGIMPSSTDSGGGLSQPKPIRFIYDLDTKTILVSNASPAQLRTVDELIDFYDQPIKSESISTRIWKSFTLRWGRAADVAEAVKDVYRDLLSSRDKAFESGGDRERRQQQSQARNTYYLLGPSANQDRDKTSTVKAQFEGLVSIGVDEGSNTILVSASEEWLPSIEEMIRTLDQQAQKPGSSVMFHRADGGIGSQVLQQALSSATGSPAQPGPSTRASRSNNRDDEERRREFFRRLRQGGRGRGGDN